MEKGVPTKVGYVTLSNYTIETTSGTVKYFLPHPCWILHNALFLKDLTRTFFKSPSIRNCMDLIVFPVEKYDVVFENNRYS